MTFAEKLAWGKVGESMIARWLMKQGHAVAPLYNELGSDDKGPRMFALTRNLILPDMLMAKDGNSLFVEAKRKSRFSWFRNRKDWTTGISLRLFNDYLEVRKRTGLPLWLYFLQEGGKDRDAPPPGDSPRGLFGGEILMLARPGIPHHHLPIDGVPHIWWGGRQSPLLGDKSVGPLAYLASYEEVAGA